MRLSRFENDRTISFVPPDGDFELMSYRLTTQVKPLIWIESQIERHSRSRVEYIIKVGVAMGVGLKDTVSRGTWSQGEAMVWSGGGFNCVIRKYRWSYGGCCEGRTYTYQN